MAGEFGGVADQGEEWWEMEQALALGRHRFLHASLRRYHRLRSSFDLQQCQDLPLLRRHMILHVPLILLNINGIDEQCDGEFVKLELCIDFLILRRI